MLVQVNDCKNSWIWIIKHIFLINEKTLLNILDTFLCKIMKRKLKCISLNYVLPSDRTLNILEIGPLYNSHTQLNVYEKEKLQCFLYLIQIFDEFKANILSSLVCSLRNTSKILVLYVPYSSSMMESHWKPSITGI